MRLNINKKGKVRIRIHKHDLWSLDVTLAKIIAPCLIEFKKNLHGSPKVCNGDVPEHLWSPEGIEDWDADESWHERWEHVLDKMIYSFSAVADETFFEIDHREEEVAKIQEGLDLFAKYYLGLWD